MSIILFSSMIGPVAIDCVLSERPESSLEITEMPVETGSTITDHAVIKPKTITLDIANEGATETYNTLVRFQESRIPFILVTGLSIMNNMLIKRIAPERDATFSRILRATVELQEIILVETAYTNAGTGKGKVSAGKAKDAATKDKAQQTVNSGDVGGKSATTENKSILARGADGLLGGK